MPGILPLYVYNVVNQLIDFSLVPFAAHQCFRICHKALIHDASSRNVKFEKHDVYNEFSPSFERRDIDPPD